MNTQHMGNSFDDFLAEEALLEKATALAVKRVIAWQIEQEMTAQKLTKTSMANHLSVEWTLKAQRLKLSQIGKG